MINILIVDDSITETKLLTSIFEKSDDMRVVGCARNGKEAIAMVEKLKPSIITMDINMPVMDGIEAIKYIMAHHPTPIVVISSRLKYTNATFNALDAGALSVIEKPENINSSDFAKIEKNILSTIKNMSEIRVIRRVHRKKTTALSLEKNIKKELLPKTIDLIAIGTSVGGPQALKQILSKLPANFPVPIVIVQHMTQGFMDGYVSWLNENISLKVKQPEQFEVIEKGSIYFAPDGGHLTVDRKSDKLICKLITGKPVSGFCPSATVLLQSVAKTVGKNAVGVLLTGMGDDGAIGLLELKHTGAHTIIQDPDSAVVFGMAKIAYDLGAVDKIVELDKIADYLQSLVKQANEIKPLVF